MDSDFAAGEDTTFVYDEISNIIKEAIGMEFCIVLKSCTVV